MVVNFHHIATEKVFLSRLQMWTFKMFNKLNFRQQKKNSFPIADNGDSVTQGHFTSRPHYQSRKKNIPFSASRKKERKIIVMIVSRFHESM